MKVWVDLANSPQVPVMRPLIAEMQRRGHDVAVTTRNYAQTDQLALDAGLQRTLVGRHGGPRRIDALRANAERVWALLRYLRTQRFDLALGHNSYAQALAARLGGVPLVTMMDYEHQPANHLAFRLARRVLVPAVFPQSALRRFGATRKAVRYPGLKEELYLRDFAPDRDFARAASLPSNRPLVVMRPPATWAAYYRGQGDLFQSALSRAQAHPTAALVMLPRTPAQASALRRDALPRMLVPGSPLDGPNLLSAADLMVGAGGTMTREAALLGTPAYSVFEGELGAVDRELITRGWLRAIHDVRDLDTIRI